MTDTLVSGRVACRSELTKAAHHTPAFALPATTQRSNFFAVFHSSPTNESGIFNQPAGINHIALFPLHLLFTTVDSQSLPITFVIELGFLESVGLVVDIAKLPQQSISLSSIFRRVSPLNIQHHGKQNLTHYVL